MARDISPDEARDAAVYERTAIHYEKLRAKLEGGNAALTSAIDEAVFANLPDTFWREAVITAAGCDGALAIGGRIVKLVEKALLAAAEVEAIREVEELERQRKESQDEARIARVMMDRATINHNWRSA